MGNRTWSVGLAAVMLAGLVWGAAGAEARTLLARPAFEPGDAFYLEIQWHSVSLMWPHDDASWVRETEANRVVGWLVLVGPAEEPGCVTLVYAGDREALEYSDENGVRWYDSDQAGAPGQDVEYSLVFGAKLGIPVEVVVNEGRDVVSVSGMEAIREAARARAGDTDTFRMMEDGLTNEAFHGTAQQFTKLYPPSEGELGDRWTGTHEHEKELLTGTYSVNRLAREDGRDFVGTGYALKVESTGEYRETYPDSVWNRVDTHGRARGDALFDVELGRLVESLERGEQRYEYLVKWPAEEGTWHLMRQVEFTERVRLLTPMERAAERAERQAAAQAKAAAAAEAKARELQEAGVESDGAAGWLENVSGKIEAANQAAQEGQAKEQGDGTEPTGQNAAESANADRRE